MSDKNDLFEDKVFIVTVGSLKLCVPTKQEALQLFNLVSNCMPVESVWIYPEKDYVFPDGHVRATFAKTDRDNEIQIESLAASRVTTMTEDEYKDRYKRRETTIDGDMRELVEPAALAAPESADDELPTIDI